MQAARCERAGVEGAAANAAVTHGRNDRNEAVTRRTSVEQKLLKVRATGAVLRLW